MASDRPPRTPAGHMTANHVVAENVWRLRRRRGWTQADLRRELAKAFRAAADSACVRRVLTEDQRPEVELWVELSSEEQLAQYGREIASQITAAIREETGDDVWVLFRVVPLSHVFLNGEPRGRGFA